MANPKRAKKEEAVDPAAHLAEMEHEEIPSDEEETEDDDDEEEEDDESEEDDDPALDEIVNIDFDAFHPDDSDFHGIRKLLLQVFRKAHVDVSDLTNHLIELNKLTIILRQAEADESMDDDDDDDDDDVYGVSGLLPLGGSREGSKTAAAYLIEQAGKSDKAVKEKLENLISSKKAGLLISERFVNIPPRVAMPLLESVNEDWKKVPKSNTALADLTHLVLICKQYAGAEETIFANGEEELFVNLADFQFDYEVPKEDADTAIAGKWKESDEELKQVRKVLVISAKKLPQMIQLVKENV